MLSAPFHGISRWPCLLGRNSWWTQVPLPGPRGWPVWLKASPSLSFAFPEQHQPHPYDSFCFPPTTKPLRLSSLPPAKNVLLLLSRGLVPPPVARRGPSSKHSKGEGFGRERWQNWFLPWQKSGARSSFLFLSLRTRPCRRFKAAMRPAQPLLDASPSLLFCLSHVCRNPKGLHARCGRGCIAVMTYWI